MQNSLHTIARQLVAPGKGILAADESFGTIEKRFTKINVVSNHQTRRAYRELLFSTGGLEQYISGIIQFDETLRDGILKNKEIISIIKVDEGVADGVMKPMPNLAERLVDYKALGAQAAKARAVIAIGNEHILENAQMQAEYARICQEAGIVPMVEPEVLMDGNHSLAQCEEVTEETLRVVFEELQKTRVDVAGMILKPNMVLPGSESGEQASANQIAQATMRVLKKTVPEQVPGITFLSGGQSEEEATDNLAAIDAISDAPWKLTFSYGRALQDSVLKTWMGKEEHIKAAQAKLLERAKANSEATFQHS